MTNKREIPMAKVSQNIENGIILHSCGTNMCHSITQAVYKHSCGTPDIPMKGITYLQPLGAVCIRVSLDLTCHK
jgi:hypothetical protein